MKKELPEAGKDGLRPYVLPFQISTFASEEKLRPGESWQYLYIARNLSAPANEFKIGFTRFNPEVRRGKLPGQTGNTYELCAVLLTLDGRGAETIVGRELDRRNQRKYPGTRKEIFLGTFDELLADCKNATRESDRIVRSNAFNQALALPVEPRPAKVLSHARKFWKEVLRTPMRLGQQNADLGTLLGRSLKDPKLAAHLERRGFRCVASGGGKVDYEIHWLKADAVLKWLKSRGYTNPAEYSPYIQFAVHD